MPSPGMITINAFSCADSILIPVQAAYLPVKGLQQLIKTIGKVKRQINPIIVNPLKKPNLFLIDFKIQTKYLKKKANQCHIVEKKNLYNISA